MSNPNKASHPHGKRFGETVVTILGDKAPALPHEHDTSSHSQHGEPSAEVKQAYKDVKRGVVDADVSAPMDTLYGREFRKSHSSPAAKPQHDKKQRSAKDGK